MKNFVQSQQNIYIFTPEDFFSIMDMDKETLFFRADQDGAQEGTEVQEIRKEEVV